MSSLTLMLRAHGTLAARILVGAFFLFQGVQMLLGNEATAQYIGDNSPLPFPEALAWVAGIVETALGAALIIGYKVSRSALALAALVLIASFSFHEPSLWAVDPTQQILFMKNMAVIGALLYMAAYGPGDGWSMANRRNQNLPQ